MRLVPLLAVALAAAAGAPAPFVAPMGRVVRWASDGKVPQPGAVYGEGAAWRVGPYGLSLATASATVDGNPARLPQLTITPPPQADGRGEKLVLGGVAGFADWAPADFAVARLDPASSAPDVILESYSGGAHCCEDVQVAVPVAQGWTVLHLGAFDNDPLGFRGGVLAHQLEDLDGDGARELLIPDDRFAYQFASYAGSYQPIRVFGLRGTTAVDRTGEPVFRGLVAEDMAPAEAACRSATRDTDGGGACAAYVADASRLGRFAEAWAVMLARRRPGWDFPARRCGEVVTVASRCPSGEPPQRVADYPTALRMFLRQYGYPVPAG